MTDWAIFFSSLPAIGWVTIILFIVLLALVFYGIYRILMAKDIKIKNFEATSENIKREQYHTEGKNLLDNQTNNAHNLLKKVWIDIYQTGKNMYQITDSNELFILEDVAHLIEGKLNYDVKNDLTRNHIIEKSDLDLTTYSDAKAVGYYRAVLAMLYQYNIQLPEYDLPKIMDKISLDEYKRIFSEIYFGARKIAGDMK